MHWLSQHRLYRVKIKYVLHMLQGLYIFVVILVFPGFSKQISLCGRVRILSSLKINAELEVDCSRPDSIIEISASSCIRFVIMPTYFGFPIRDDGTLGR